MKASDIIKVEIWNGSAWVDYSVGTLDIQIVRGVEEYNGPLSQPEVGQCNIISKNPSLDPYQNNDVRYNAKIRVTANNIAIFTGNIEGINVEYQPKGDPPIVNINAIDMMGTLYKHTLSPEFVDSYATTDEVITNLSSEVAGFTLATNITAPPTPADEPLQIGNNGFDALIKRVKTDIGFVFTDANNEIRYYRLDRDDPLLPYNANPAAIDYDYDGNGESYLRIYLSDGFEEIVNDIELTGYGNAAAYLTSQDSVNLWGKAAATAELATNDNDNLQDIANELLVEMAEPIREIYELTWDATLNPDTAKGIDIYSNININHRVSQSLSINRKYAVVGIKHTIDFNNWQVTYILRNYDYQTTSIENPVIIVDPETGDTATNFKFTWDHPNKALFTGVEWNLDDGFTSTDDTVYVDYTDSGVKDIVLVATTIYGYTKTTIIKLEVSVGRPQPDFTWTTNAQNVFQFTYTGDSGLAYDWDFGDGTTSVEKNPQKWYASTATRTVTVTVTNSFGSASKSYSINTQRVTVIPARFARIRIENPSNNYLTYEEWDNNRPTNTYHNFAMLRFSSVTEGNIDYQYVNHNNYKGFIGDRVLDAYNRHQRITDAQMPGFFSSSSIAPIYPMKYVDSNVSGTAIEVFLDLGQEWFDLETPTISTVSPGLKNDGSEVTKIHIDISYDNTTWYQWGYFQGELADNTLTEWITDGEPQPPNWTSNTVPSLPAYLDIRYVKFKFNDPAVVGKAFYVNTLGVITANDSPGHGSFTNNLGQTKEYPYDSLESMGVPDLSRELGGTVVYDYFPHNPFDYRLWYLTNAPGPNPGDDLSIFVNTLNIQAGVWWNPDWFANWEVGMTFDLETTRNNICGFYIDYRDYYGNIPAAIGDINFEVTFSVSNDGITFIDMGTYTLHPTQPDTGGIVYAAATPLTAQSTLTYLKPNTNVLVPPA